ncbi:hypothetical protein NQ176_g5713 [Zarea fungicola]|uniref:Uncharacterized protein n=1 Tax=Zarea fungicola TaxID=93591 RepID=A0ACC1N7W8_9HYPO|nr:hypothetical protein NQ176_g5713 [Lecanicillium fungicola]
MRMPNHLLETLERTARLSPDNGLLIYAPGEIAIPTKRTYAQLAISAFRLSHLVRRLSTASRGIVLLHLDNHLDHIQWLWAVIAADQVPAISTPFSRDLDQRRKHIQHLQSLLQKSIVITTRSLVPEFLDIPGWKIYTIEDIVANKITTCMTTSVNRKDVNAISADVAVLMLTSGSTGYAKAVILRHDQIIASLRSKSTYHGMDGNDVFFNWVGMDHVANLTEIHLQALALGSDQVHAQAQDLMANPLVFLRLIQRHSVAYTFAPSSFLASVKAALDPILKSTSVGAREGLQDLSSLRCLITGGEAIPTILCSAVVRAFGALGAPAGFLRPGFGMTETCAGSIYSKKCPNSDLEGVREFASVGYAVFGVDRRVTAIGDGRVCNADETGRLEIRGTNVFSGYFNSPKETTKAFTKDGWFITGDLAFVDSQGSLHLVGRATEAISINGVKHYPHAVEQAVENANIGRVAPSYTAVFPYRVAGAASETLCVVYLPSYDPSDAAMRLSTYRSICSTIINTLYVRPYRVLPLTETLLLKSTLGKLSRARIRAAFEAGAYDAEIQRDEELLANAREICTSPSMTAMEKIVHGIVTAVFDSGQLDIGVHQDLFLLGVSSLELAQLRWKLQQKLNKNISIATIINFSTIHRLATVLESPKSTDDAKYDPVVTLRSVGTKTPLWLIHPGVGEVLVFIHLAKHFTDRPVYALRAWGFDGEAPFTGLDEMIGCYREAIQKVQPDGPYAIAGYSYGGTVAFEIAKLLQHDGHETPVLAIIDQPPHIGDRMLQASWGKTLIVISRFLDVFQSPEQEISYMIETQKSAHGTGHGGDADKTRLVEMLLTFASTQRLEALGLDKRRLQAWVDLACNSHKIAQCYEPSGSVREMEVLYGHPIEEVAKSRKQWLETKLSHWANFTQSLKFHQLDGSHYTLLSSQNAPAVAAILKSRLDASAL